VTEEELKKWKVKLDSGDQGWLWSATRDDGVMLPEGTRSPHAEKIDAETEALGQIEALVVKEEESEEIDGAELQARVRAAEGG